MSAEKNPVSSMFCNQCEQTSKSQACTVQGVCGKSPEVAALQDIIVYALRGLAIVALDARQKGIVDPAIDALSVKALFVTLTNVSFEPEALVQWIHSVIDARKSLAKKIGFVSKSKLDSFEISGSATEMALKAVGNGYGTHGLDENIDIASLKQTLLYGLKGVAAYADHAAILGKTDPELFHSIYKSLAAGFDGKKRELGDWVAEVLAVGTENLKAMELLDAGNTETFGHPTPTPVSLGVRPGKAILVSGHDLKDLYDLLQQTEGKGINIYTHGEMLPAHGYPGLSKFKHLAGHFGTAWQNQHKEFPEFPGAILFTTNCIQKPLPGYIDNVFTTGVVSFPDVKHVKNGDFTAVIKKAQELPGFTQAQADASSKIVVTAGFASNAVLGVADKVIAGVKSGAIRHFFLVGGCDGAKPGRNYYTEFVEKAPKDTVILTLACGKFRFFDKDLGNIGGIPRLLDIGQCNDAYSAVQIALALAKAFNCGVNELPLSLVLSWYEQKAVAILLSLFALGIKNVRLGPTLPAFVTPNVLKVLVDNFNVMPISTPDEDLKAILG